MGTFTFAASTSVQVCTTTSNHPSEAAKGRRFLSMRHFDVQLIGGIVRVRTPN
jgi:hypothetical protein